VAEKSAGLVDAVRQATAPSSSLVPSWAKGPEVAAISQITSGEFALLPPPPLLHPATMPATRTALAAAVPAILSGRRKRRAEMKRGSSIKAPFGFGKD